MSLSLISACFWVLACTVTAMLPMRFQYVLGMVLLLAAPALLVWLGIEHGPWLVALGAFTLISFFRKPLRYFARRALGRFTKSDGVS